MTLLSSLVREWRYSGKAANMTDEDRIRDQCADDLEKIVNASNGFIATVSELQPLSTDDCYVIVQDWDESDPDQNVAIRLAAEVIRLREAQA